MKKLILVIITLLFVNLNYLYSQVYTQINSANIVQQNNHYISNNAGLFRIAAVLDSFRNSWEKHKKKKYELEKTKLQLEFVRNRFKETKEFPKTIKNGWHIVSITDNYNYCKEAKVLVENNKIMQLVIDNYIEYSLKFKMISSIKNAKCLVSLILENNDNENVEVYFIYDLEQNSIADKPLEAGFVSFWSDLKNARHIKLWIDKNYLGELKGRSKTTPEFFDINTITLKLKPGKYLLRAEGRGRISWKFEITIKENKGLKINLNKLNKL